MTQYLLAVHMVDGQPAPEPAEMKRMYSQVDTFNKELQREGQWVFAGGLHPATTATVVRSSGGEVVITDGPYSEAKEQLGGFWVVEAPDLDVALSLAARASAACEGPVEVRPFQEIPG